MIELLAAFVGGVGAGMVARAVAQEWRLIARTVSLRREFEAEYGVPLTVDAQYQARVWRYIVSRQRAFENGNLGSRVFDEPTPYQ